MLAVGNTYKASRSIPVVPATYTHIGSGAGPAGIAKETKMRVTALAATTFDLILLDGGTVGAQLRAQKTVIATDWTQI